MTVSRGKTITNVQTPGKSFLGWKDAARKEIASQDAQRVELGARASVPTNIAMILRGSSNFTGTFTTEELTATESIQITKLRNQYPTLNLNDPVTFILALADSRTKEVTSHHTAGLFAPSPAQQSALPDDKLLGLAGKLAEFRGEPTLFKSTLDKNRSGFKNEATVEAVANFADEQTNRAAPAA